MAIDVRTQLVSGKARKTSAPLQLPPGSRVAVLLLGAGPGFLQRFLSTRLLRRGSVKVALAPRTIRLKGKAGQWPNPGWGEALEARKAGLVQRVALPGQDAHRLGVALDLTPVAERAMLAAEGMPPAQRHALVLAALEAAASAPGMLDGYDHVFTVAELAPGEKRPAARLQTQAGPRTALDHLLREMILNGPGFPLVARDPSLFLLMSPDGQLVARLDPASPRTSGRSRELTVLAGLEKLYSGHELDGDEAEYVGAPTAAAALEAPLETAAPRDRAVAVVDASDAFRAAGQPAAAEGPAPAGGPAGAAPTARPPHLPAPPGFGVAPPPPRAAAGDPAARSAAAARIAELREAHEAVPFPVSGGVAVRLGELLASPASSPLEPAAAPGEFLDPAMSRPVADAQVGNYLARGHYDRDLAAALASLAGDADFPLFLTSVERSDTSDALTRKETVVASFRGPSGRATQLRFDLPLFTPDGYLRMGGVKYNITRQILARPVIKIREDQVLITTSYNKAIVARFGQVASPTAAYVRSLASWIDREVPAGVKADLGSAAAANSGYVSPVEYNNIARTVRSISAPGAALVFSRPAIDGELAERAPWFAGAFQRGLEEEGGCAVGWMLNGDVVAGIRGDGTVATYSKDGEVLDYAEGLAGLAWALARRGEGASPPPPGPGPASRRYAYSRVKLLSQWLPTALICGNQDGLEPMMQRAGVRYRVSPAGTRIKGPGWGYVDFADATVAYETRLLRHTLLMNGLKEIEESGRPIADYAAGGPGWALAATERLGAPGRARALKNFEASFVDPVAAELLAEDGLPTDLSGVLLYASSLLETNQHLDDNDMASYRVRSGPELVPALLYKNLHREMERVRATRESAAPQRLSLAPNQILRDLASNASNVEEMADLNPLLEAELRAKASWTGAAGGQGGGDTVTRAQRSFHPSMLGVFGYYSPDSAEIGVKRSLAYGGGIRDTRGRLKIMGPGARDPGGGEEAVGSGPPAVPGGTGPPGLAPRLLALGELMSPFTAQHADPPRIGMQSKQGTHTLPIRRHSPMLVGSGAERALAYSIGDTFATKAKASGRIGMVDAEHMVARLDYDNGRREYVDLGPRSVKNSGGGCHTR